MRKAIYKEKEVYVHTIDGEHATIEDETGQVSIVRADLLKFTDRTQSSQILQAYSVCPVCRGTGKVSPGFYATNGLCSDYSTLCRTCQGTGVLKN